MKYSLHETSHILIRMLKHSVSLQKIKATYNGCNMGC